MTDQIVDLPVTVPKAVALKGIPDVELVAVGSWNASTGPVVITDDDVNQAIAALDCPGVHNPVLKLGHEEPDPDATHMRWDGEPAVGWISNMRLSSNGAKVLGDYTGVPAWLVDVMPSAYPQRSVEIQRDLKCQIGHVHPFVITAVSLLGVYPPAVGVIKSLNDVQALYTLAAFDGHPAREVTRSIELAFALPGDDRDGRRELTDVEQRSTADFDRDHREWEDAVAALMAVWPTITRTQRDQLTAQIANHIDSGHLTALANLDVDSDAAATALYEQMLAAAHDAAAEQRAEAARQGVQAPAAEPDEKWLSRVAASIAATMAASLAATAGRDAAQLAAPGVVGRDVADGVAQKLSDLSSRFLQDQFGGAVGAARMAGRYAVLSVAPTGEYYAAEVNDRNTCLHPDTVIASTTGPMRVADVRPGDQVLTHKGRFLPVDATMRTPVDEELIRLRLIDGRVVRLTYDHPVIIADADGLRWRYAGELSAGDLVVDQSAVQNGRELRVPDLYLGQAPHGVTARFKVRGLPVVDVRSQGVPVRAIGFDDERAEREVARPRPDASLRLCGVSERRQGLANPSLYGRFQPAPQVAVHGAVAAAHGAAGSGSEIRAALFAGDNDRWAAARLGAVAPHHGLAVPERCAASAAFRAHPARSAGAGAGAVVVPVRHGDRNRELGPALRARLGNPVRRRSSFSETLRVSVSAFSAAVDRPGPAAARDDVAAALAVPGRRSASPRRTHGAALAERPTNYRPAASCTRLVHDVSVMEISAVERERHAGFVYDLSVPGDETFFADGVLVHNCSNCRVVDGTRFDTLDEAMGAYGAGGYASCSGGGRCRGRLITVWEADAQFAADIPVNPSFLTAIPTTVSLMSGGPAMPLPATIKAKVSAEDISRAYYKTAGYSNWITAMHVDPLELVTCDDTSGDYYRVPVTVNGDNLEFGTPVQVQVEYVDVKTPSSNGKVKARSAVYADDSGEAKLSAFVWSDRASALDLVGGEPAPEPPAAPPAEPAVAPDVTPAGAAIRKMAAATKTPPADTSAGGSVSTPKEASGMPFDAAKLREALGLSETASADDALTAFAGALSSLGGGQTATPATATPPAVQSDALSAPVLVPQLADGNRPILLDPSQLAALQDSARKGETAWAQLRRNERDGVLDEAIRLGKFPASRREYWVQLWDRDPDGTRTAVNQLAANVIPVLSQGYLGDDAAQRSVSDQAYEGLFGKED